MCLNSMHQQYRLQNDAVVNLHMNGAGVFTYVMEGGWAGLAAIMQLNLRDC